MNCESEIDELHHIKILLDTGDTFTFVIDFFHTMNLDDIIGKPCTFMGEKVGTIVDAEFTE